MHHKILAAAAVAAVLIFLPSPASAACCDSDHACCGTAMACCEHGSPASDISVLNLLPLDTDIAPLPAARQAFEVWFTKPTWVGKTILQGRFIIEHDNDRMARGEPCTHIYAFDDREKPMATFHCTHLERGVAGQNTVVLITMPDGWRKLTEFQFAGESAAHGYPTVR
jgi:hypothetical protein